MKNFIKWLFEPKLTTTELVKLCAPPTPFERPLEMCSYRGGALIVTDRGNLFLIDEDLSQGVPVIKHIAKLPLS